VAPPAEEPIKFLYVNTKEFEGEKRFQQKERRERSRTSTGNAN